MSTSPSPGPSEKRITRVAKACEPCRSRKTKCDITENFPCTECTKRSMDDDCVQRSKARKSRRITAISSSSMKTKTPAPPPAAPVSLYGPLDSSSIERDTLVSAAQIQAPSQLPQPPQSSFSASKSGTSPRPPGSVPTRAPSKRTSDRVESLLYSLLAKHCPGLDVDFGLPPERLIDFDPSSLSLDAIGLGTPSGLSRANHWINLHFTAIHHNTPFLHRPTVENIASRYFNGESTEPDQRSLLFSVLALGSFREQTWDSEKRTYSQLSPLSATSPDGQHLYPTSYSASVLLFELSQRELDRLDIPTELAVQSLFLLHTYVSNTSLGRWSRDFVARAVMMSHEVGLNRRINWHGNKEKQDVAGARRRAVLYLYVLFADVYLSALDNHPPLIKSSDYDSSVFDPILFASSTNGTSTPPSSTTAGLSAFVDLVKTGGQVLETAHGLWQEKLSSPLITSILELEQKLDELRDRLGSKTFSIHFDDTGQVAIQGRAVLAGRLLRQIHYNWIRIALRKQYLESQPLSHSSLAVCARAALSILSHYRIVMSAGLLNLPWMQLRRISTSVQLVLIAHIKGELLTQETENAISDALILFKVLGTRWQSSKRLAASVERTAAALGLHHKQLLDTSEANQPDQRLPETSVPFSVGADQTLVSSMAPSLDPFFNSLSFLLGQDTTQGASSIDMMDGFGAWIESNSFEAPDFGIDSQGLSMTPGWGQEVGATSSDGSFSLVS